MFPDFAWLLRINIYATEVLFLAQDARMLVGSLFIKEEQNRAGS